MKPSDALNAQIEHVNSNNYTWKANTCLLTKDHQSYNKTLCEPEAKKENNWISLAQTAVEKIMHKGNGTSTSKAQKKSFTKNPLSGSGKFGEKTDEFVHSYTKAQKWAKKYKTPDEIPDSLIPDSYDFRNLDGYDYTGPLRDQAECGSCYTIGFIQTIEARLKLKYAHKSDIPQLSPQFLLMCNYLNEGCAGGWAIFHGFLAENGHLVKEECAPYRARTKGDKCENYSQCPGFAKIKSSYYVGGYNFEPSEKLIQKEMLMHGPLVTEFKADDKFQMYKSGILFQDVIPVEYSQKEESETIMVPSTGSIELAQTSAP